MKCLSGEYILSIDLGTSGCKVVIFSINGRMISHSYGEYPLYSLESEFAEQDPRDWWTCTSKCIKEAITRASITPAEISAIGVTGQGTSIVFLDKEDKLIRPSILYMDSRAEHITKRIEEKVGKMTYTEAKIYSNLQWIREKEAETYRRLWKILDAKEFIAYKLTGEITYDSIALPDHRVSFLNEVTETPREFFGNPHDYSRPVGYTTKNLIEETGLCEGIPVVVGPWDGMCSVIGSGLIKHGQAMDVAGTTEIVAVVSDKFLPVITHEHVIDDLWLFYDSVPIGIAHRWLLDVMFNDLRQLPNADPYNAMNMLAESVVPGAEDLYFVPLYHGAYLKPHTKGVIIGLTIRHNRVHFIRSFYEGAAFYLRYILESIEKDGLEVREIRVSGGGAKSSLWNQIKADVTGRELEVLKVHESGSLGVAILSSVAIKVYGDLIQAIKNMVQVSHTVKPRKEVHEKYSKHYVKYLKILQFIDALFAD